MTSKDVKFTFQWSDKERPIGYVTNLPHSAVYLTLTMMSFGSLIFGMGLSSIATCSLPLKTTAFIVSLEVMLWSGRMAQPLLKFYQIEYLDVITRKTVAVGKLEQLMMSGTSLK